MAILSVWQIDQSAGSAKNLPLSNGLEVPQLSLSGAAKRRKEVRTAYAASLDDCDLA
jgi:hypothetical protein